MKTLAFLLLLAAMPFTPVLEAAANVAFEREAILRRVPDLQDGERLYMASCAACHGAAGEGQREGWAPRIAGQRISVIVSQLVDYRRGRRWDDRMQSEASDHRLPDPQQLADVAAYASRLPGTPPRQGRAEAAAPAGGLYAQRCASCHGAAAEGSERPSVPRLAGQNSGYLVRQLHDFVEGRRLNATREHVQLLDPLDRDQITALADHLSRL